MPIPQFQVDAFTDKPFAGNPAAVVLLGDCQRETEWMQSIAAENNLSETVYLQHIDDQTFGIRWFTPKSEVELCGHATLASAHILWEQNISQKDRPITFRSASYGDLVCRLESGGMIVMDFPADTMRVSEGPAGLVDAMGCDPVEILEGRENVLYVLDRESAVLELSPNFSLLAKVNSGGVMATARSKREAFDVLSRCFFPCYGIDEDPVTGSAHCSIGPYWSAKLGKNTLHCHQASTRGGDLRVEVRGERVVIAGHAVTTIRSDLLW